MAKHSHKAEGANVRGIGPDTAGGPNPDYREPAENNLPDMTSGPEVIVDGDGVLLQNEGQGSVATVLPPESADEALPDVGEGTRYRRTLIMKQLLPNKDWILKNVVAGGEGTRGLVGRVTGVVTEAVIRTGTLPDGTPKDSIVLLGDFAAESYVTNEQFNAQSAFLPAAYAEGVKRILDGRKVGEDLIRDVRSVIVDVDIGLEATGKTIPYEWVVISYIEEKETQILRQLKARRGRPVQLLTGPAK